MGSVFLLKLIISIVKMMFPNNHRFFSREMNFMPMGPPMMKYPPPAKPNLRKCIQNFSYGLNDVIGRGLTSVVFLGRDDNTMGNVVIKVISLKDLNNQENKSMLLSQISTLKELKHENIMACYEVFTTSNNCYIITEYCEQGDLENFIRARPLACQQALPIIIDIIKGFLFMESKGIIHRDLKSSNILLKKGRAKIADFGFAKKKGDLQEKQKYNVGSPLYMAPQIFISNKYSSKSDIFALGVIFYEILFGQAPWESRTEHELIEKMMSTPLNLQLHGVKVGEQIKQLLRGVLQKRDQRRWGRKQLQQFVGKISLNAQIENAQ